MRKALATAFATAIVLISVVAVSDVATADDDFEVWYSYNDTVVLTYPYYTEGMKVEWQLDPQLPYEKKSEYQIQVDAIGYDNFGVTQKVTQNGVTDTKQIQVIVCPLDDGEVIRVRYMNGTMEHYTHEITNKTTVRVGTDSFAAQPDEPVRSGSTFTGWYLDRECTREFDPRDPITDDIEVYAGWTPVGSGGSGTVIVNKIYTVTFNTGLGLTYSSEVLGERNLRFSVGVQDGYELIGSISVSSSAGSLSDLGGGEYLLDDIDCNIVITISGDVRDISDEPESGGFPWWVLVAIVLIIALAAVAVVYLRSR